MTTTQFVITDGPSTDRVVDAFRYVNDRDVVIDIHFVGDVEGFNISQHLNGCKIASLSYESGASGMFLISGSGLLSHTRRGFFTNEEYAFEGFYNANQREGNLSLTPR